MTPNERHTNNKSVLFTVVVVKRQCMSVNIKMCNTTNIKITDVVAGCSTV